MLVGDRDEAVGNTGAAELLDRLLTFGFPQQNIHGAVVHSTPDLVVDHFAPLQVNADAKRLFWLPGDRIVSRRAQLKPLVAARVGRHQREHGERRRPCAAARCSRGRSGSSVKTSSGSAGSMIHDSSAISLSSWPGPQPA